MNANRYLTLIPAIPGLPGGAGHGHDDRVDEADRSRDCAISEKPALLTEGVLHSVKQP
jgi:hypothetical protein